jgi:hypothetical protein
MTTSNQQGPEGENQKDKTYDKGKQSQDEISDAVIAESGFPPSIPPSKPQTHKAGNEGNCPHQTTPNWVERWTLALEFLGLLGLAFYCFVNWRELRVFDSERQTMEREFLAGETNAEKQLALMRGQLTEMQKDERAWVGPTITYATYDVTNTGSEPVAVHFSVRFKNTGRTPAIKVIPLISEYADIKSIPNFDKFPNPVYHSMLLPPDGEADMPIEVPTPIYANTYLAIKTGHPFYIVGTIWYDDIFGTNHWTQFCTLISADFKPIPQPVHNTCDDAQTNQTN